MKGYATIIMVILISIISIFLISENNQETQENGIYNYYYEDAIKLNNYTITLNEKAWYYNWNAEHRKIIRDFNSTANQIFNKTFNQTKCTTDNWKVIQTNDLNQITHDLNCTTLINTGTKNYYNNFLKTIIIKGNPLK
ncbi:MAG TPA: hypothetical protein PKK60_01060 [archaeon]|nr:hypothetical protein [archaeon]